MPSLAEQIDKILLQSPYTEANKNKPISKELLELLNKIKNSGNLSDSSPTVTPSQLIKPYYGESYSQELEKAKAYFNSKFPIIEGSNRRAGNLVNYDLNATDPYSGLERPIRVTTEDQISAPLAGSKKETRLPAMSSHYIQWGDGSNALQIRALPLNKKIMDAFEKEQNKLSLDQQILSAAEHEAGHAAYRGGITKMPVDIDTRQSFPSESPGGKNRTRMQDEWDDWGAHMADEKEITNGLGRIQRETFALTGSRITNQAGLEKILKKIDPKTGAAGLTDYSPDARRTLDLLYKAKTNKLSKQNKGLYQELIKLLPSFVSNESSKKNIAKKASKSTSSMASAVSQNKKQYGLNLPIG
jgi:hypothetical protein